VIELNRSRQLAAILRDALAVYRSRLRTFLAMSALVVVPAQLVVMGVGLEQLSAGFDSSQDPADVVISAALGYLLLLPLIGAMCIHALLVMSEGERPRTREMIVRGLESFAPMFLAVLLAALGVTLGLLMLIVPGVFLAITFYFVPQAVVLEGARDTKALRASAELVRGFWWRTFGVVLVVNLIGLLISLILGTPFVRLAESQDQAVWQLVGTMLTATITMPFTALASVLLYFDLKARRAAPGR
jgi:hypothetical protein